MGRRAAVVEVDIDEQGRIKVPRVDVAFDCGPQVNPERIRSQLEGAVIMGLASVSRVSRPFRRRFATRCLRRRASEFAGCPSRIKHDARIEHSAASAC